MMRHSFHGFMLIVMLAVVAAAGEPPVGGSQAKWKAGRRVSYASPRYVRPRTTRPASHVESAPGTSPADGTIRDGATCDGATCDGATCHGAGCGGSSCIGGSCDGACGGFCGDVDACIGACPRWSAGVEFTLVKPHFEGNIAFTTSDSDDATFETLTDTEFNYDTDLAPRVWIERVGGGGLGMRVVYWQFDYAADNASGSPPASGFGSITHPAFGEVDLSTTTPGSVYSASSTLNAYTIDIEGTKSFGAGMWGAVASTGIRFGEVEQDYRSNLQNAQNVQQGTINFSHRVQGVGPTVGLRVQRPFLPRFALFGVARGSLLFGDAESTLVAVEDEDLANAFTTRRNTSRDDVLPISELQVGLQWMPAAAGMWHPYFHLAFESQLWNGAGNASSEEGNLGFYGLNVAVGLDW